MLSQAQPFTQSLILTGYIHGSDNAAALQGVIAVQTLMAVGLAEVDATKVGVFNLRKPKWASPVSPRSCQPGSICTQGSGPEYRFRREELCDRFSRFRVFCLFCFF